MPLSSGLARLAAGVDGRAQEIRYRHARDRHRVLESQEKPQARAVIRHASSRIFCPLKDHFAFGHLIGRVAHQGIGQGRFTRPIRAHDGVNFALLDGQIDALQDLFSFDTDMQIRE